METEENPSTAMAKRILRLLRSVYYALRRALSSKHMPLDLHLLFERGKLAGKSLGRLLFYRCIDHAMSFYLPREIQFSCSNTPTLHPKRRNHYCRYGSAELVSRAFEILDSDAAEVEDGFDAVTPSPSPTAVWRKGSVVERHVDKEAEEFIRRFREQLRSQQRAGTPEWGFGR